MGGTILKSQYEIISKLSNRNSAILLLSLVFGGILMRLYFTPFHIPLSLDAIDYFAYAVAMNREGIFPTGYLFSNFGLSTFLSITFLDSNNFEMIELMNIQRIFTILISSFTAIPIYLLSKNFFQREIAILSASLFIFDPRIIENSVLGITDSLFIFFTVMTILFIFYKEKKFVYLSFVFAVLASFVRYEGLLLIFPVIISQIILHNKIKQFKFKFSLGVFLCLVILIPLNFIGYEETGKTAIFSQVLGGGNYVSQKIIQGEPDSDDEYFGPGVENKIQIFLSNAIQGLGTYLVWILIPVFVIFSLLGIIFIPKKITKNKIVFGSFFVFVIIASVYAYGRGIQDTRYLLVILPLFSILTGYGFKILAKVELKKLILITIFSVVLVSSIFIEIKNQDFIFEKEIFEATRFLINNAQGVNDYTGNKYVKVAELQRVWPDLLPKNVDGKMGFQIKKFPTKDFDNLIEYINFNKNEGLSHLVIVENERELFLNKIFHNEKDYEFLKKIYDSKDLGFKNQIKIFEINYNDFNLKR